MGDPERMQAYLLEMGVPLTTEQFRVISGNGTVAWEICKIGLGIAPMDGDIAAHTPEVERVLPTDLKVTFPLWLVTHRELHTSPRIRLVFDVLARALS